MSGNSANWFVDRHIHEGRSTKIAFKEAWESGRELTYAGLAEHSGCVADALQRAGIHREERAAMFVLDQLEFPLVFWGALKAGVVPVALNTLLSTDVYRTLLNDSRAAIVFVSAELLDTVLAAAKDATWVRKIVVIGGDAATQTMDVDSTGTDPVVIRWSQFMEGACEQAAIDCSDDEVAFWLYSSGSTGAPKGVRHVHQAMRITCDTFARQVLNIQADDTVFSAAKLFFAYGLGNGLSFPLSVGATSLLYKARPTPDAVSEVLANYRPTIFYGVPTLFAALVHQWKSSNALPKAPLRACTSAGEALPAEISRQWQTLWGFDIVDGVGSTEMLHIFLSNRPDDVQYGTSGYAVPGYEVRLVDETGADVKPGDIGELLVKGESSAADYWNQRQKTRQTFEGEWTRTGDKYEQASDGRFIYCGRTDDMFKVSGIWVSPFEVEQALLEYPGVLEAAVVAHRDADNLEKPKAFIVLKDDESAQSVDGIKDHIKEKIGKWKYPRWVEVVDELPKTATGKIQRFKLRESV